MSDYLLVQAVNGLFIGVIYAVVATGLTVTFSILKIVNFAHGEFYMAGGYAAYFAIAAFGIPPALGIPVAMLAAFALSIVFERLLLTPLYSAGTDRKGDYGILITFGISILLRNLVLLVCGPYPLRPPSVRDGSLIMGAVAITWDRLIAAVVGAAMMGGLVLFMSATRWGHALNAVGQSKDSASIVGINPKLFYSLAFGLGGALAGGAGALVGPIYSLTPSMGLAPDTQAFAIVILGGMGSISGAILAGMLIGMSESMFVAFFPDPSRALTYAQAFSLVVLMVVMLVRPTGLFGRTHVMAE